MKKKIFVFVMSVVVCLTVGCSSIKVFPKDKYVELSDGRLLKTAIEFEF